MPDPAAIDPIVTAVIGMAQQSPLFGLAVLWWIKVGSKADKAKDKAKDKGSSCSYRVANDGTLQRIDGAVEAMARLADATHKMLAGLTEGNSGMSKALEAMLVANERDAIRIANMEDGQRLMLKEVQKTLQHADFVRWTRESQP